MSSFGTTDRGLENLSVDTVSFINVDRPDCSRRTPWRIILTLSRLSFPFRDSGPPDL